ncbi:MAG: hypothetical protein LBT46_10020 [Planctomycetaceae bacterium]|jgi:hypothetical protein|nr:hypothetical protein [Planctomycetaceae bacterium]
MKLSEILKGTEYNLTLTLFDDREIAALEKKIIEYPDKKGNTVPYVNCIVRDKEVQLKPEEVVRQLYAAKLIEHYILLSIEKLVLFIFVQMEFFVEEGAQFCLVLCPASEKVFARRQKILEFFVILIIQYLLLKELQSRSINFRFGK